MNTTTQTTQKMTKLEKFIRTNFNMTEDDLKHVPRLVTRCQTEIDESEEGVLSEYALYDIVDDELVKIDEGK